MLVAGYEDSEGRCWTMLEDKVSAGFAPAGAMFDSKGYLRKRPQSTLGTAVFEQGFELDGGEKDTVHRLSQILATPVPETARDGVEQASESLETAAQVEAEDAAEAVHCGEHPAMYELRGIRERAQQRIAWVIAGSWTALTGPRLQKHPG